MRLIIDIPEYVYEHIREYYEKNDIVESTYSYIYHGTPIPDSDLNEAVRIAYEQGRKDALEEVRAEVSEYLANAEKENKRTQDDIDCGICIGFQMALETVNKYKGVKE